MNRGVSVGLIVGVVAFGCSQPTSTGTGTVDHVGAVATIGGDPVMGEDLRVGSGEAPEVRRRALDREIQRRLAAAEARRRGLDAKPELERKLLEIERAARVRKEALLRDQLFANVRDGLSLSEFALRAHYEATKLRYTERQLRLRRWSFRSREAAERMLGEGAALDEATAESLGPSPVRELPRTVLPEALRLERPGARMLAGSDEEGWSVIELAEVLPAEPRPFEAVRAEVEMSLREKEAAAAFRALLADLRAKADVRVDSEALARMSRPGDAEEMNQARQRRSPPR